MTNIKHAQDQKLNEWKEYCSELQKTTESLKFHLQKCEHALRFSPDKEEIRQLKAKLEEKMRTISKLGSENEDLRKQLKAFPQNSSNSYPGRAFQNDLVGASPCQNCLKLQDEIESLKQEVKSSKSDCEKFSYKYEKSKEECEELKSENKAMKEAYFKLEEQLEANLNKKKDKKFEKRTQGKPTGSAENRPTWHRYTKIEKKLYV